MTSDAKGRPHKTRFTLPYNTGFYTTYCAKCKMGKPSQTGSYVNKTRFTREWVCNNCQTKNRGNEREPQSA